MVFGEVLRHVVELPAGGVQLRQLLGGDRLPEAHARLGERRAGPGADGPPAVVVDRPVAQHLEVLGVVVALRVGVVEGVGEADPVQGRLGDAADRLGRLDAQQVQDRGHHVDDVRVLGADLAPGLDPLRPGHDERIAGPAPVGLALPPAERRVPGQGPAPRVVVEVLGPADLIDQLQALLQRLLGVVEELRLVRGPGRPALGAGAVVGDDHDQRVVQLPVLAQELDQPPDLVIGVGQEPGEHLHHPGVQPPRRRRQRRPVGHVGIVPRQLRVRGDDAEFLLPREHLLPVGVPARRRTRPRTGRPIPSARGAGRAWRRNTDAGRTAWPGRPAWRRR